MPVTPGRRSLHVTLAAYVRLTKPRIVELLLITTVPAMILAASSMPPLPLVLSVLAGGAAAAAGANTLNCYLERDRDRIMRRTRDRPLPTGDLAPANALAFGIALEIVAVGWLWARANLLAAVLAGGATLFYVFVYTLWLKPRSPQSIVIGGAAGAAPVLVGWAAVTGGLGAPAWVLFGVVFFWTPAHFWALALGYRDDYEAAGIPMLPIVRGTAAATLEIMRYAIITVLVTFALGLVATVGPLYLATAGVLGAAFVRGCLQLRRSPTPATAIRLFALSNAYLALVFVAIAADTLLR